MICCVVSLVGLMTAMLDKLVGLKKAPRERSLTDKLRDYPQPWTNDAVGKWSMSGMLYAVRGLGRSLKPASGKSIL